jgi:hypothetical protein
MPLAFTEAAAYLKNAHPENWAYHLLHNNGAVMWGQRTSNFAESSNATIKKLRYLEPFDFHKQMIQQEAAFRYERQEVKKWAGEKRIISKPINDTASTRRR